MQYGRLEHLMHEIEAYLTRHPEAADSPDGIACWWLCNIEPRVTVSEVSSALERLLGKGVIKSRLLPDGREIFCAAQRNTGDKIN